MRDVDYIVRANANALAYTSCCIPDITRDILIPIINLIRPGISVGVTPFLNLMDGPVRRLEDSGHRCYILDDNSETFIPTTLEKICQSPGICYLFVTTQVVQKNSPAVAYLYQLAVNNKLDLFVVGHAHLLFEWGPSSVNSS